MVAGLVGVPGPRLAANAMGANHLMRHLDGLMFIHRTREDPLRRVPLLARRVRGSARILSENGFWERIGD